MYMEFQGSAIFLKLDFIHVIGPLTKIPSLCPRTIRLITSIAHVDRSIGEIDAATTMGGPGMRLHGDPECASLLD